MIPVVIPSSTSSSLPPPGTAGSIARLTDGTRGLWMDNGTQWVPIEGRTANPFDFGAKADGTDDSAAVQAAIDSFGIDGGTVLFPACYSFTFYKALILDRKRSIRLVGVGGSMYEGSKPTLIYTGAGAPCHSRDANPDKCCFISMRSAHGIELRNLNIKYTNPDFKGDLINSDWDPAANSDSAYLQIDSCAIYGDADQQATKAHSLLRLNKTIVSTVRNTHFLGGDYAIIGRDPEYSVSIQILNCAFNFQHISAIRNADEQWLIEGNTFEPLADGSPGAYSHEINANPNDTHFANGMTWINNWFGDVTSPGTSIQVRALAFNFIGNRISYEKVSGGIGIKFEGGTQGANISGNRFDGSMQPLVFEAPSSGMGYHYGVSVTGNDCIGRDLITGTDSLVYAQFLGNNGGPTRIKSQGEVTIEAGAVPGGIKVDHQGTTLGPHGSPIYRHRSGVATWAPPSLASGEFATATIEILYAEIGDTVAVGFSQPVPGGALLTGAVTQPGGVVTVTLVNLTGAPLDLAPGILRADVWQHLAA